MNRAGVSMRIISLFLVSALAVSSALAQQPAPVPYPKPEPLDAKTSPLSAAAKSAMFGIAHPNAGFFSIDRAPVTAAHYVEFLNSLGIKTLGRDEPGGNVGPDNIPAAHHALLLKFSEKPLARIIIGLDSEDANIGTGDGTFKPNPGEEKKPVVEVSIAGASAYCTWRGAKLPTAAQLQAVAKQFPSPKGLSEWSSDRGARDEKGVPQEPRTGHANVSFRCAGD